MEQASYLFVRLSHAKSIFIWKYFADDKNENDELGFGILENLKKDLNFIDLLRFLDNSAKVY